MSLVEGDLEHRAGEVDFVGPGIRIGLGTPAALGLTDGNWTNVALGVRAEDVKIVSRKREPPGTFEASVQLLEPIGSDTFVELAAGPATIVARVNPGPPARDRPTVRAEMAPGRIHLFERANGDRINAGMAARRAPGVILGYPSMHRSSSTGSPSGAPGRSRVPASHVARPRRTNSADPDLEGVISPRIPSDLSRTPRLRWQQLTSAGIDHLTANPAVAAGRDVSPMPRVYAIPIAQYVLAAILRIAEQMETRMPRRSRTTGPRRQRKRRTPARSSATRRC